MLCLCDISFTSEASLFISLVPHLAFIFYRGFKGLEHVLGMVRWMLKKIKKNALKLFLHLGICWGPSTLRGKGSQKEMLCLKTNFLNLNFRFCGAQSV